MNLIKELFNTNYKILEVNWFNVYCAFLPTTLIISDILLKVYEEAILKISEDNEQLHNEELKQEEFKSNDKYETDYEDLYNLDDEDADKEAENKKINEFIEYMANKSIFTLAATTFEELDKNGKEYYNKLSSIYDELAPKKHEYNRDVSRLKIREWIIQSIRSKDKQTHGKIRHCPALKLKYYERISSLLCPTDMIEIIYPTHTFTQRGYVYDITPIKFKTINSFSITGDMRFGKPMMKLRIDDTIFSGFQYTPNKKYQFKIHLHQNRCECQRLLHCEKGKCDKFNDSVIIHQQKIQQQKYNKSTTTNQFPISPNYNNFNLKNKQIPLYNANPFTGKIINKCCNICNKAHPVEECTNNGWICPDDNLSHRAGIRDTCEGSVGYFKLFDSSLDLVDIHPNIKSKLNMLNHKKILQHEKNIKQSKNMNQWISKLKWKQYKQLLLKLQNEQNKSNEKVQLKQYNYTNQKQNNYENDDIISIYSKDDNYNNKNHKTNNNNKNNKNTPINSLLNIEDDTNPQAQYDNNQNNNQFEDDDLSPQIEELQIKSNQ